MIRILQIGLNSNHGGIERCIMEYFRNIDRTKFMFDFVDIYGEGIAWEDDIVSMGGKIYTLPNYKKHPLKVAVQLKKILADEKYDIVHYNLLSAGNPIPVIVSLCSKSRPILVAHSHNANIQNSIIKKILHTINLNIMRHAKMEKWACSELAGNWMWGKAFKRENVINNAIDTKRFCFNSEARKRIRDLCGFKDDDKVIGFVGRIAEQKNPLFLLEILDVLKRKNSKYKLLIVGGGEMEATLKKRIGCLQLEKDVYISGEIEDTSMWYSAMDIFVLPSLFEGLPIVGIEAQACGLPCFVSDRITQEANVTNSLLYLSIDHGANMWASAIEKYISEKREGKIPSSYVIEEAAKNLENKYSLLVKQRYAHC